MSAQQPIAPRTRRGSKRGYAAVLTMMFLVIAGVLAAGFSSMISVSTAMARNDRDVLRAMAAAQTGLAFYQHKLVEISPDIDLTGQSGQWCDPLAARLALAIDGTNGLARDAVQYNASTFIISVPPVSLPDGTSFSAQILPSNITSDAGLTLQVVGTSGSVTRTLALNLNRAGTGAYYADGMAIAAIGSIDLGNSAKAGADFWDTTTGLPYGWLNKTPITNVTILSSDGSALPGGSVLLIYDPKNPNDPLYCKYKDYLSKSPPSQPLQLVFPSADVSFLSSSSPVGSHLTTLSPSRVTGNPKTPPTCSITSGTLTNTVLPVAADSGYKDYTLSGVTINGVLYVRYPNTITIGNGVTINGTIVFEPPPAGVAPRQAIHFQCDGTGYTQSHDSSAAMSAMAALNLSDDQKITLNTWGLIAPAADVYFDKHDAPSSLEGLVSIHDYIVGSGGQGKDSFRIKKGTLLCTGSVRSGNGNRQLLIDPVPDDGSRIHGISGRDYYLASKPATYREL